MNEDTKESFKKILRDDWERHHDERNCLSWWFPKILAAGFPVARTLAMGTGVNLTFLCEVGEKPDGLDDFFGKLGALVDQIGLPCFLRTGQTSHKHDWRNSCF